MCRVDESVEDGVSRGCVGGEYLVPVGDRDLADDDGGLAPMAVFDKFHEVEHLLVVEALQAEVVKDDQVRGRELVEASVYGGRSSGQGDVLEELLCPEVPHLVPEHAGLSSEGGGDPALAGACGAGDEDGLSVVDEGAGGEMKHLLLFKSPGAVEGQLLKAGRVAEPCVVYEPCVAVRPSGVLLGLEQQLHAVLE